MRCHLPPERGHVTSGSPAVPVPRSPGRALLPAWVHSGPRLPSPRTPQRPRRSPRAPLLSSSQIPGPGCPSWQRWDTACSLFHGRRLSSGSQPHPSSPAPSSTRRLPSACSSPPIPRQTAASVQPSRAVPNPFQERPPLFSCPVLSHAVQASGQVTCKSIECVRVCVLTLFRSLPLRDSGPWRSRRCPLGMSLW